MIVFISQDYSYDPTLAVKRAYAYSKYVVRAGHIPLSPVLLFHGVRDNGTDYFPIITDCFRLIDRCDEVYEFDCDQEGHGRILERKYAETAGKPVKIISKEVLYKIRPEESK